MKVELIQLNDKVDIPAYKTAGAGGVDLQAAIDEPLHLLPNQVELIGTGVAINIANSGYVAVLAPRSGTGHKRGLILGNGIGVIDSDYQGELKLSVWNRSQSVQTIEPLERIAQLVILPVQQVEFEVVEQFTPSERGENGFGSTGT